MYNMLGPTRLQAMFSLMSKDEDTRVQDPKVTCQGTGVILTVPEAKPLRSVL